jgi:ABC-type glycerol-3-phosphate transport system substrate-binding protein
MPFAGKVPASLDSLVRVDGKLLMLPTTVSTVGGIYNTRTFEAKGWTTLPKTWSEFLGMCEKIKAGGMFPIAAWQRHELGEPAHHLCALAIARVRGHTRTSTRIARTAR